MKARLAAAFAAIIFATAPGCSYGKVRQSSVTQRSCSSPMIIKIPNTPGIKMINPKCDGYIFEPQKMSVALNIFVKEYAKEFNVEESKVWSLISGLTIEVSLIPRTVPFAYSVEGKLLEKPYVTGLCLTPDLIWVEIRTSQIWSSSLVHELVHAIIWRKNKVHGDPDHEGTEFSGWFDAHTSLIKRVEKMYLDLEL